MTDLIAGREFFKMSGSGNDFVVFDGRRESAAPVMRPEVIRRICARGTGIGADGLVVIEPTEGAAFRMRYFNRDTTEAFCGNASLCSTRLAVELGIVGPEGFDFETPGGRVSARIRDGLPEIDLQPVTDVRADTGLPLDPGEERMGYATVGVPHLVIRCADAAAVDVDRRGAQLRRDPTMPHGANANFVSVDGAGQWTIRTYERGVEAETLACGSGAVASAILLAVWGQSGNETTLRTRSDRLLRVHLERDGQSWRPSLGGEGRIVYRGVLGEV